MASADVNASLEKILCQIEGAGKVRVLITVASGEEIVYQSNNKTSLQIMVSLPFGCSFVGFSYLSIRYA